MVDDVIKELNQFRKRCAELEAENKQLQLMVNSMGQTAWEAYKGMTIEYDPIIKEKQMEIDRRKIEERFRYILDNLFDGVALIDNETNQFVYTNQAWTKLTGHSMDELNKYSTEERIEIIHPDDQEKFLQTLRQVRSGDTEIKTTTMRMQDQNGEYRWFNYRSKPAFDSGTKTGFIIEIIQDITEQKEAEETLEKKLSELKAIFKALPDGVIVYDMDIIPIYYNDAAKELFDTYNVDPSSTLDKRLDHLLYSTLDGDLLPMENTPMYRSLKAGEIIREQVVCTGGENPHYISISSAPMRNSNREIIGAVSALKDVTDKMLAENALRESEEKYRTLFNTMNEGFCLIDVIFDAQNNPIDWCYLEVNPAYKRLMGLTDVDGKLASLVTPEIDKYRLDFYGKIALTGIGGGVQNEIKWSNRWFEISAFKLGGQDSRRVAVLFHDVTERKQAEDALCASHIRLNMAISAGRLGTWDWWAKTGEAVWSDEYFRMLGYEPGEVKPSLEAHIDRIHPEDLLLFEADFRKASERGGAYYRQCRLLWPDGTIHWIEGRGLTDLDENGQVEHIYGVVIDITEQRESEECLKELNEQLRQSNQNKSHFLSVLSHELRNPLASIMMGIELQKRAEPRNLQDKQVREIMERQGNHLTRLVDDLLDISRIDQNKINLKKEPVELNGLVQQVAADYQERFENKMIRLNIELNKMPIHIEADQARIIQVVSNLLHNALKFTRVNDTVSISVTKDHTTREAVIRVRDTGVGISSDLLPNLFNPFTQADHSLARSGESGLGLGLAIAKSMIELHGGSITAQSDGLEKGTQFTIRLPISAAIENENEQEKDDCTVSDRSLRILIIDDIPDIAQVLSSLLELLGHKIITASSGAEGISRARDYRPDVILCDIGLPDISGYDVAGSIRNDIDLRDVRLIALSGYAYEDDLNKAITAGFDKHLAKPVDIDILQQVLRDIVRAEQELRESEEKLRLVLEN